MTLWTQGPESVYPPGKAAVGCGGGEGRAPPSEGYLCSGCCVQGHLHHCPDAGPSVSRLSFPATVWGWWASSPTVCGESKDSVAALSACQALCESLCRCELMSSSSPPNAVVNCDCSDFTDEETKAWKGWVTCANPQRSKRPSWDLKLVRL